MKVSIRRRTSLIRIGKILLYTATIMGTTKLTLECATLTSASTAAFGFLIVVLLSAFFGDLLVAITTSIVATLCFDYFYLPPVGTFHISAFSDWISLAAFLLASVIISRLAALAAEHLKRAGLLDVTLVQLNEFGGWLLALPHDSLKLSAIAQEALRIFSLEYCSLHVYAEGQWQHSTGVASSDLSREIETRLESLHDHSTDILDLANENMLGVRYIQLNKGMTPLALLALKSGTLPIEAMEIIASMIGIKLIMIGEVTS
ncbi:MAG: DUF4118 domain-containing protein [bacterium]